MNTHCYWFLATIIIFNSTLPQHSATISYIPIPISINRAPKGIRTYPYAVKTIPRYATNLVTNGSFSYVNNDKDTMHLIPRSGSITIPSSTSSFKPIKIVFLGDMMVSKSGNPPQLDARLKRLLQSAAIIVANIESPVIESDATIKRGLSLQFSMPIAYLKSIYDVNPQALWVCSVANNHAFDTSKKSEKDISGFANSIKVIRDNLPNAVITGNQKVLIAQLKNGPKIGIIGWTDVMNNDARHIRKPATRGDDVSASYLRNIKATHNLDYLIGFAHGNEEQSYYPLKATRNRWNSLLGVDACDLIVGHGPHVVQPAEKVGNSLIFHSIGNFYSAGGRSQTKVGLIPEIILASSPNQKEMRYKCHFIQQKGDQLSTFKLSDQEALYQKMVNRFKKIWEPITQQCQGT